MGPDAQGLRQVHADVRWHQHREHAKGSEEMTRLTGASGRVFHALDSYWK
jgi:hypothetical protein